MKKQKFSENPVTLGRLYEVVRGSVRHLDDGVCAHVYPAL